MKVLKMLGKIGAIGAAVGGLILAGKSGLGESLFKTDDVIGNNGDDAGDPINTAATEEKEVPTMEEIVEEPADSSDTE
jgi:hypothetical protein